MCIRDSTYDVDHRVTEMQFDDSQHKIAYTYDELGRIKKRALTNGSAAYTTNYTCLLYTSRCV